MSWDVEAYVKAMPGRYQKGLADLGESFTGRRSAKEAGLSSWVKREKPRAKECYMNAGKYAIMNDASDLTYYEGYWMWHAGVFPVHHAWLVDAEGNVIDLTAEDCDRSALREGLVDEVDPGADQYFGMAVPTWFVRKQAMKTHEWGVVSAEYLAHLAAEEKAVA